MQAVENIGQNKYKSIEDIYSFIINLLLGGHFLGFVFAMIAGSNMIFLSFIFLGITIYIKSVYDTRNKVILSLWLHISFVVTAIVYTNVFGWGSGFYMFIITLVAINYFYACENKTLTYIVVSLESLFVIYLYYLFGNEPPKIEIWLLNTIFASCFLVNFIIIARFCMFASFISSAGYKNLKSERENLEKIAKYDQLTGLLNRRSMELMIKQKLKSQKDDTVANRVVMLGDIDDFKHINDTFGHDTGDFILKSVSDVLKMTFRKEDYICRWGGEEFLIILPDTKTDFIYEIQDRLLRNISSIRLPNGISITMTFGMVICVNSINRDVSDVIGLADQLLYKGKNNGKDRIEMEILR